MLDADWPDVCPARIWMHRLSQCVQILVRECLEHALNGWQRIVSGHQRHPSVRCTNQTSGGADRRTRSLCRTLDWSLRGDGVPDRRRASPPDLQTGTEAAPSASSGPRPPRLILDSQCGAAGNVEATGSRGHRGRCRYRIPSLTVMTLGRPAAARQLRNRQPSEQTRRAQLLGQLSGPLRRFLATESGSALLHDERHGRRPGMGELALVGCIRGAMGNWGSVLLGDAGLEMDLGHWINDGLMAVFFFVIGLEVRRESLRRRADRPSPGGAAGAGWHGRDGGTRFAVSADRPGWGSTGDGAS